ncbi:DNA polymerase III subunit beta [Paenibacillus sp. Y412MC10]|uniref:DNA polymerase III subunit beta n=1 Tax=Geobacillus sp. (strain Y412MC10) TaxID=481743 RepID=UPI0011AB88F8|nr:DNA polymerase III subunit beta [Paenibacillus sp. Y412MC10]
MFKIKSNALQSVVSTMAKSVKESGIGERNVYIKAVGESIVSFYFTSPHLSAEKRVMATEVGESFFITTSMKELAIKVGALPSEEEIEVKHVKKGNGQHIELVWGSKGRRSEMKVAVLNEETEFLEVPLAADKVTWGPKVLSHLVNKFKGFTVKSTSQDAVNSPVLSGISISRSVNGNCVLRASDRHNTVTYVSSDYGWLKNEVILDSAYLQAIANLVPADCDVEVGVNENASLVLFQTKDSTCVCRVTDGKFPEVDHIYDHNVECKYHFDRPELLELCSRVQKIVSTGTKMVRFESRKIERHNVVFAVVPGVLEQQMGATIEGLQWNFAINAEKLFECAKFFEGEDEVTLYVKDPFKPITLGSEEEPDVKIATLPYRLAGLNQVSAETVSV